MIKFLDVFNVVDPEGTKIKFNMHNNRPSDDKENQQTAYDALFEEDAYSEGSGGYKMNAHRKRQANNNFGNSHTLLAFAQYKPYGDNFFIFGGAYKIEKVIPEIFDGIGYKLTLLDDFKELRKRLVIKLNKPIGRDLYNRKYVGIQEGLNPEIYELLPSSNSGPFNGYDDILLTHKQLRRIYRLEAPEWKKALSRVKGVYCITDTTNGKSYIGSATGQSGGIGQRWSVYANVDNLTGGNKAFEELKVSGSKDKIINNFTYSILEVFDMKTNDKYILDRESFGKKILKTREFGMNNN